MTTLEIIFVSGSIGILVGMGIMWWRVRKLEFDKEILLDFNERLIADRDEVEQRYLLETKAYIRHLDSHVCVFVPDEEEWPEEISFQ
jgi:hypothetical protein